MTPSELQPYLNKISLPLPDSHKGQNGKVMIIGGSELFHSASQWALLVVSRMVDMVFYSSIPSNNELVQTAKEHFSNGIVITRQNIEEYIDEADVVLIGPGMERVAGVKNSNNTTTQPHFAKATRGRQHNPSFVKTGNTPTADQWNTDTEAVVNYLLSKYPNKKWVIDAGALQMVEPSLLNENCIITPHQKEWQLLQEKTDNPIPPSSGDATQSFLRQDKQHYNSTTLLKGPIDTIYPEKSSDQSPVSIPGGNVGMTKGGTGDVLAGLVAGLYCFSDNPFAVAIVGSYINKKAGDELFEQVGPFFNATDLANQIPQTLKEVFKL